jgi:tRNA(Ile)-lysidine synthetase-like protein
MSVSHPDHITITAKARNHHDTYTDTESSVEGYATSYTGEQVYFFSLIAKQQQLLSYTLRYVNLAEDMFVVTRTSTNDNNENKKLLRKEKKVRDILVDRKVPLHRRDRVLVLCAADDTGQANKGIIIAILVSSTQIIIADRFNPQTIYDDDLESQKRIEFSIRSSD